MEVFTISLMNIIKEKPCSICEGTMILRGYIFPLPKDWDLRDLDNPYYYCIRCYIPDELDAI